MPRLFLWMDCVLRAGEEEVVYLLENVNVYWE